MTRYIEEHVTMCDCLQNLNYTLQRLIKNMQNTRKHAFIGEAYLKKFDGLSTNHGLI